MGFDAMSYLLGRKLQHQRDTHSIYGFRIDGGESDPSEAVTYLADAVGLTPAHMDFANDVFDWGSWANAFFLPRPCMLKYDGTVDYYLDPEDYSKKADGTASDVANAAYGGNAMMEWGRDGKRIWYKIVPDSEDHTSARIYIADYRADADYRAWSFVNNQGILTEHFYTPIYNGSLDSAGRLRSLSGVANSALCQNKTSDEEVAAAERNNPGEDKLWYTEVYADVTLISLLLILLSKSLDSQTAFGKGRCSRTSSAANMLATGTMNGKGAFWGSSSANYGVKVFGMENWWGNQWRRYAGHCMVNYVQKYKLTRGAQDGSAAEDYIQSIVGSDYDGYLIGTNGPAENEFIKRMLFTRHIFQVKEVGGADSASYWCDLWNQGDGVRYARRGGACDITEAGRIGAFQSRLSAASNYAAWDVGVALSCKPLA